MEQQRRPQIGMQTPEEIGMWVREMQDGTRTIGPVEMGFFLCTSAAVLLAMGEPAPDDDDHNTVLKVWWDRMNDLPHNIKMIVQKNIRAAGHALPPAPWEEVDDNGNPV